MGGVGENLEVVLGPSTRDTKARASRVSSSPGSAPSGARPQSSRPRLSTVREETAARVTFVGDSEETAPRQPLSSDDSEELSVSQTLRKLARESCGAVNQTPENTRVLAGLNQGGPTTSSNPGASKYSSSSAHTDDRHVVFSPNDPLSCIVEEMGELSGVSCVTHSSGHSRRSSERKSDRESPSHLGRVRGESQRGEDAVVFFPRRRSSAGSSQSTLIERAPRRRGSSRTSGVGIAPSEKAGRAGDAASVGKSSSASVDSGSRRTETAASFPQPAGVGGDEADEPTSFSRPGTKRRLGSPERKTSPLCEDRKKGGPNSEADKLEGESFVKPKSTLLQFLQPGRFFFPDLIHAERSSKSRRRLEFGRVSLPEEDEGPASASPPRAAPTSGSPRTSGSGEDGPGTSGPKDGHPAASESPGHPANLPKSGTVAARAISNLKNWISKAKSATTSRLRGTAAAPRSESAEDAPPGSLEDRNASVDRAEKAVLREDAHGNSPGFRSGAAPEIKGARAPGAGGGYNSEKNNRSPKEAGDGSPKEAVASGVVSSEDASAPPALVDIVEKTTRGRRKDIVEEGAFCREGEESGPEKGVLRREDETSGPQRASVDRTDRFDRFDRESVDPRPVNNYPAFGGSGGGSSTEVSGRYRRMKAGPLGGYEEDLPRSDGDLRTEKEDDLTEDEDSCSSYSSSDDDCDSSADADSSSGLDHRRHHSGPHSRGSPHARSGGAIRGASGAGGAAGGAIRHHRHRHSKKTQLFEHELYRRLNMYIFAVAGVLLLGFLATMKVVNDSQNVYAYIGRALRPWSPRPVSGGRSSSRHFFASSRIGRLRGTKSLRRFENGEPRRGRTSFQNKPGTTDNSPDIRAGLLGTIGKSSGAHANYLYELEHTCSLQEGPIILPKRWATILPNDKSSWVESARLLQELARRGQLDGY